MEKIIKQIKNSCFEISELIKNTSTHSLSLEQNQTNNSNEIVKNLDIKTNNILKENLAKIPEVHSITSEEEATEIIVNNSGHYLVAFDPLDGSSNIDCNAGIGTIFGIYIKKPYNKIARYNTIASGYCLYSSSTQFVSTNYNYDGIKIEQLCNNEWKTIYENHFIPKEGKYYSCNLANQSKWKPRVKSIIHYLNNKNYSLRYIGSLVGDGHRTIVKGGLFMYPSDTTNKNGKLRQYYEVIPFSYLFEKAGGLAINDEFEAMLDEKLNDDMHFRRPLILSSSQDLPAF